MAQKKFNDPSISSGFNTGFTSFLIPFVDPSTGKVYKLTPAQLMALFGSQYNLQSGTSYTAALTDGNGVIEMGSSSANTVTIPPNSSVPFPVGTQLVVSQYGSGATTIAAGAGVTIRNLTSPGGQYKSVFLYKRATDEWVMSAGSATSSSSADTTPPTVSSMTALNATTIRVVFSEPMGTVTTAGWSFNNGGAITPSSVAAASGVTNGYDFTVAGLAAGQTITGSYNSTTGATADVASNKLASFTNTSVTNSISASGTALAFTGPQITQASGVYTATTGGTAYGHTGQSGYKLRAGATGRVWWTYQATDGVDAIMGFNDTYDVKTPFDYSAIKASAYISGGTLYKNETGTVTDQGAATVGRYYGIYRDGSTGTIKLQYSTDLVTWTDVVTFTYTSTAVLYIVCDINGDGKLYNPQGSGVVSALGSNIAPSASGIAITAPSLTNNSSVYTVTAGGTSYGNTGISSVKLAAGVSGWIGFKVGGLDGIDAIVGFKTSSSAGGYSTMLAGAYFTNTLGINKVDSGAASASGGSAGVGDFVRINRNGSTGAITIDKSVDDGATWTTVVTLTATSTADLWLDVDVNGDGKLYYPQGQGLA